MVLSVSPGLAQSMRPSDGHVAVFTSLLLPSLSLWVLHRQQSSWWSVVSVIT